MNAEKVLKQVIEIKSTFPKDERDFIDSQVKTGETCGIAPLGTIASLILECKKEIAETEAKKNGDKSLFSFANWILKRAMRHGNFSLHGAFEKDGYWFVCDGYMCLKTLKDLGLMRLPPEVPQTSLRLSWAPQGEPIPRPSVADLKEYIEQEKKTQEHKQAGEIYYDLENGPRMNAPWLLEIIKGLPNAKLYLKENRNLLVIDEEKGAAVYAFGMWKD